VSGSNDMVVVLVTAPSFEEATKVSQLVVEGRLAACATVIDSVRSIFRWEGKISSEQEALILIKTTVLRFAELVARIKEHHSYAVPEIIALPVVMGSEEYLKWVRQETRK
jgi:periplasmic divalent cation tolerance protein